MQLSCEPFFAGITKLVNQIALIPHVSLQQILGEHARQFWFYHHSSQHHRLLFDVQKNAVSNRSADDMKISSIS
jgi:hypothetical protein